MWYVWGKKQNHNNDVIVNVAMNTDFKQDGIQKKRQGLTQEKVQGIPASYNTEGTTQTNCSRAAYRQLF